MEWLAEILLSLLWDVIKTLVLQWLLTKFKEWWGDFPGFGKLVTT